jgi:hypothetical protein
MIICESEFERPDPNNPDYSLAEVDFYAWIPATCGFPNHRLSLRKNLKTGEYEVYRAYVEARLIARGPLMVITNEPTEKEEVAFRSKSLEEAIAFARSEVKRFHGHDTNDRVCTHRYPNKSMFCKKFRQVNV